VRTHSGWAVIVAVGIKAKRPAVLGRWVIGTADPTVDGSRQPYHAAQALPIKEAAHFIRTCKIATRRQTYAALRAIRDALAMKGQRVECCCNLLASGKPPPTLEAALASHAMLHAAEGELYRAAVNDTARRLGFRLVGMREGQIIDVARTRLELPPSALRRRLKALGADAGPPWRQDEKLSALAAWLALV